MKYEVPFVMLGLLFWLEITSTTYFNYKNVSSVEGSIIKANIVLYTTFAKYSISSINPL